jgi:hypothetical protein
MPVVTRPQKITFGEMRESGVRGIMIYCSDYKCSHSIAISADQWQDDIRCGRSFRTKRKILALENVPNNAVSNHDKKNGHNCRA